MEASELTPLRRNKQFQLLWLGSATSVLGTQISTLAFPLAILAMTKSSALAGVVGAVAIATDVVVSMPAGAITDRWDRRRTLLVCEGARMIALAVTALAIAGGWASIPLFIAAAIVQGAGGALVYPIRSVTIRRIVRDDQLASAYAQEEARAHAGSLLGPPLGGVLFAAGRALPFVADAVSYLISFVCAAFAKIPRHPITTPVRTESTKLRHEIREGLTWLRKQKSLRAMVALLPLLNIAGSGVPLLTIILLESRHVASAIIGLVLAVEGAAGLIGALVAARLARALPPGRLMLLIVWSWAVLVSLMAIPMGAWWIATLLGLGVLLTPAIGVAVTTQVARATPEHLMGRTMSTVGTIPMVLNPLGPLLAGVLGQALGPTMAMLAFGAYLLVCSIGATMSRSLTAAAAPTLPAEDRPEDPQADADAEAATPTVREAETPAP